MMHNYVKIVTAQEKLPQKCVNSNKINSITLTDRPTCNYNEIDITVTLHNTVQFKYVTIQ